MPHQYSDSGYESSSRHIRMARQASGSSQPLHAKNGETFTFSIQDQFPVGEYRDARSSISGLESLIDESQNFSSPMDLLPDENIDPRLSGSNVLAGLADHFSLDDTIPRGNLTQTTAGKGPHQHDHTLNISSEDVSVGPWNSFHVNEAMSKRQRPDHLLPQGMPSKRRNIDNETEYSSQPASASRYGSSPSRLVTQQSRSDYQPNQTSPFAGQVRNDFSTQTSGHQFQLSAPQLNHMQPPSYHPVSPERHTPPKPNRTRKTERKHACTDCPPGDKVFTTNNDLIRHKKTVHGQLTSGDRIWICRVEGCQSSRKIWPRLDNFKQHVVRMHKDQSVEDPETMDEVYDPQRHASMEIVKPRNRNNQQNPRRASEQTPIMAVDQNGEHDHHNNSPNFNRPFTALSAGHAQSMGRLGHHTVSTPLSSMNNNPGTTHSTSQSSVASNRAILNAYGASAASMMLKVPRTGARQGLPRQSMVPSDRRTIANPETFMRQQQEIQDTPSSCLETPFIPSSSMQDFAALMGGSDEGFEAICAADAGAQPFSAFQSNETVGWGLGSASSGKNHDLMTQISTGLKEWSLPPDFRQWLMGIMAQLQSPAAIDATNTRSGAENSSKKSKTDDKEAQKLHRCSTMVSAQGKQQLCPKAFPTPSELKKHENRHLRRYGCTFDHCYKRFGTKWEWKRHEHNQHVQQEGWRCSKTVNGNSHKLCAQVFHDKESFVGHVSTQHGMDTADEPEEIEDCRLAKKWLGSYWCGFCQKIVRPPRGTAFGRDMNDERYNHVSDHIDGINRQYDIMDWVELSGGGRTKGEMKEIDKESSVKPDPTQQEPGVDDPDDNSPECDPETEATSPEESERSHLNVDTAQMQRLSSNPSRYDQMRMSSASQPTLQITSPQGEVLMSGMNDQTNTFRQPTQIKDVPMYTGSPQPGCQECMNVYCVCGTRFPGPPQQQQGYDGNEFDDQMIYHESYTNFEAR